MTLMLIYVSLLPLHCIFNVFRFHLLLAFEMLMKAFMEDVARYVISNGHRYHEHNAKVASLW